MKNLSAYILLAIFVPLPFWVALLCLFLGDWSTAVEALMWFGILFIILFIASLFEGKKLDKSYTISMGIYAIVLILPKIFFSDWALAKDKNYEYLTNQEIEKADYEQAIISNSDSLMTNYLRAHSVYFLVDNGRSNKQHFEEIQSRLYSIKLSKGITGLEDVLKWNDSTYCLQAQFAIDSLVTLYYKEADATNSLDAWESFQSRVSPDSYRDSQNRIDKLETSLWSNESSAWELALRRNSFSYYQHYLDLYPNGINQKTAVNQIIQLFEGNSNELPELQQVSTYNTQFSNIEIYNETPYTLYLYYSGNDSKNFSIPAYSKKNVRLENGKYKCVASVNATSVHNYSGISTLTGGEYSVEYYIDSPEERYRRSKRNNRD